MCIFGQKMSFTKKFFEFPHRITNLDFTEIDEVDLLGLSRPPRRVALYIYSKVSVYAWAGLEKIPFHSRSNAQRGAWLYEGMCPILQT